MHMSLSAVTGHHIQRRKSELTMLLMLAALLQLAAGIGLAYVAGFSNVRAVPDPDAAHAKRAVAVSAAASAAAS